MILITARFLVEGLILSCLAISVVSGQLAIPLGPKSLNEDKRKTVRRSPSEEVVNWKSLHSAVSRLQSRYAKKANNSGETRRRRWIALDSLPQALRELAATSNDQSSHPDTPQTNPSTSTFGLLRASSEPSKNSGSATDLQKATAFARLGLFRGSQYIHYHQGSRLFKKVKKPVNPRPLQGSSQEAIGQNSINLRTAPQTKSQAVENLDITLGKQRSASSSLPSDSQSGGTTLIDSTSEKGDIEFYGELQIGTPPKKYMIDFDTGSSDMWVKSLACKKNCGKSKTVKHVYYNPELSTTSKDMNQTFRISYGVGGVSGVMFQDTVSVSGFEVQQQEFASCDVLSEDWVNDPADGVLGMAFETISTSHVKPWFYNAISQNPGLNQADSQMFSFAMGRSASGSYGESELFIGGQNAQKYNGNFKWAQLLSKTYWKINLANMYCNNGITTKFKVPIPPTTAIIDSGTTYIAAPPDQAKAFWDSIPNSSMKSGDGFYTFPCDQKVQLTLDFGDGIELLVNELDMNLGKASPGSDRCVGAVFSGETGGDWILGIAFMKNYYTTFDFAASRIGFALPNYH